MVDWITILLLYTYGALTFLDCIQVTFWALRFPFFLGSIITFITQKHSSLRIWRVYVSVLIISVYKERKLLWQQFPIALSGTIVICSNQQAALDKKLFVLFVHLHSASCWLQLESERAHTGCRFHKAWLQYKRDYDCDLLPHVRGLTLRNCVRINGFDIGVIEIVLAAKPR